MSSGVRVVGASTTSGELDTEVVDRHGTEPLEDVGDEAYDDGGKHAPTDEAPAEPPSSGAAEGLRRDRRPSRARGASRPAKQSGLRRNPGDRLRRRGVPLSLSAVAILGVAGTAGFGMAWAGQQSSHAGQAAARSAATRFLIALTNFNAKTVDADFSTITGMATGSFASQANKFFNSSIRQELEDALATSRGQIRSIYVQSYSGGQASYYAVVDQLYANNKITAPQSDVLRVVIDLSDSGHGWKIADVTVLTGPTSAISPSATGSSSSAGSPGSTSNTATGG